MKKAHAQFLNNSITTLCSSAAGTPKKTFCPEYNYMGQAFGSILNNTIILAKHSDKKLSLWPTLFASQNL